MSEFGYNTPDQLYKAYIFDIDGTVSLGEELLPSAGETLLKLRELGCRIVFLSNNPTHTRLGYATRLTHLGIPTGAEEVVNSSFVLVNFLRRRMPGATLFVIGEAPLQEELQTAGFRLSEQPGEIQAVVASFDRTFTYHKLQVAFDALRAGAHFFATNADRYCPVPGGGQPDAAAIIAAVEACTNCKVEVVVGKPSSYMAEAILDVLGLPANDCLMVGDRLETDVRMGLENGMHAALTLTGATNLEMLATSPIKPTYVVYKLGELLPG